MRVLGIAAAGSLAVVTACSSSGHSGSSDPISEAVAFSYVTNLLPVEVSVGGARASGYVDTGDPIVLLDPQTFPAVASLPATGGDVPSLGIGSQTASNVYVIPTVSGLASPDPAVSLAANVGCSAICPYVATFNYRDVSFAAAAAAPAPPAGLQAETVVDFSLKGGSVVDGVTLPTSRIVVPVSIEGTTYTMILDSGASYVTVSQAAFTAITQDGRPTLSGGPVETTGGTSSSSIARVSSIHVGGAEVDSVIVAHDTSFDTNLASIATDTGVTIDGSLGGTFLNHFYVTVDYPNQKVHFAQYDDLSWVVDPEEQIGISLALNGSSYVVAEATGDAASQGVATGDGLASIDGQAMDGLGPAQASVLLFGPLGATKIVTFGAGGVLAGKTLSLTVEEMLPQ